MSASKVSSAQPVLDSDLSSKKGTGKEKDNSSSGRPERSPSPEATKCAICLGDVVNRSCSNSCVHQFCFGCLLEWSKVKPECPLCKSSFRSIYHNFRSTTEYDEYHVPTPVPHLSIRFTASGANYRLSPDIMMVRDGEFATYGVDLSMMRDAFRDRRFIRVLEARAAHQHSPLSAAHAYDGVSIPSPSLYNPPPSLLLATNPFSSASRPEYFGDFIQEHRRNQEEAIQMPGYQNRRRRYDRNEWVQPFGSTLQRGSVLFPSVEYIRSHPAAITRLRAWLYRELNVLLGLHRSRDQLGFLYDLILHVINQYDVRSNDFREMVSSYFGGRTAHFQHELYHFVISGMSMEEYDRMAAYPVPGSRNNTGSTANPEVITLSDEEESRSRMGNNGPRLLLNQPRSPSGDIVILDSSSSDDDESQPSLVETVEASANREMPVLNSGHPRLRFLGGSSNFSSSYNPTATSPIPFVPACTRSLRSQMLDPGNLMAQREQEFEQRLNRILRDPSMPRLEPQTYPEANNFSYNAENSMTIDRSRATAATTTVTNNYNRSSSSSPVNLQTRGVVRPSVLSSGTGNARNDVLGVVNVDSPPDFDIDISLQERYSSPTTETDRGPPDFPILTLRNRAQEREQQRSATERQHYNTLSRIGDTRTLQEFMEDQVRNASPLTSSQSRGNSAFVPFDSSSLGSRSELSRPPRPSCIHNAGAHNEYRPSSPAFRIDLFPHGMSSAQVMDLSRSAGLIPSSSRTNSSATARHPQPSSSRADTSHPKAGPSGLFRHYAGVPKKESVPQVVDPEADSDELECLGSFPIEKKPPLAVITLSSDDEESPRVKHERTPPLATTPDPETELARYLATELDYQVSDFNGLLDISFSPTTTPPPRVIGGEHYLSSSSTTPLMPDFPTLTTRSISDAEPSTSAAAASRLDFTLRSPRLNGFTPEKDSSNKQTTEENCSKKSKKQKHSKSHKRPRMVISSSSEASDDDDEASNSRSRSPVTSKRSHSTHSSSASSSPLKRKSVAGKSLGAMSSALLVFTSSDSDSPDSDDSDYGTTLTERKSSSSKKRSNSSKKKHKVKKSKKSKKCKDKDKERSRKSGSSSKGNGDSTSPACAVPGGSNTSNTSSGNNSTLAHKSKKKSSTRTVQAPSSSSTTNMNIYDFDDHPSGLLDLSFNHRADNTPMLPQVVDKDDDDFRIPPSAAPSSSSTVDPSALFGSPSRTIFHAWWEDYASERRSWND